MMSGITCKNKKFAEKLNFECVSPLGPSIVQVSVQLLADKLCLNDVAAVMKHSKQGVARH